MHLYIGQEAVSTDLIAARKPQDRVITAYHDHGVAINCGISTNEVMAELLGKATGVSKGKGGSMHLVDVNKNFWGGHAIVGAHLPIASGLALGDSRHDAKHRKNPSVPRAPTKGSSFHDASPRLREPRGQQSVGRKWEDRVGSEWGRVREGAAVSIGWRMKATISVDHRLSDCVEAAKFMQALAFLRPSSIPGLRNQFSRCQGFPQPVL